MCVIIPSKCQKNPTVFSVLLTGKGCRTAGLSKCLWWGGGGCLLWEYHHVLSVADTLPGRDNNPLTGRMQWRHTNSHLQSEADKELGNSFKSCTWRSLWTAEEGRTIQLQTSPERSSRRRAVTHEGLNWPFQWKRQTITKLTSWLTSLERSVIYNRDVYNRQTDIHGHRTLYIHLTIRKWDVWHCSQ